MASSRAGYLMRQFGLVSEQLNSSPKERYWTPPDSAPLGYNPQASEERNTSDLLSEDDKDPRKE